MSVTETKMVKISEIVLDVKIYPRENKEGNKYVILKYAEEMRVGDVFPPILLGLFEGKYYLVDGWHRIKANEKIGKVRVLATTKQYSNKREIYKDAVKENCGGKLPLTLYERTQAFKTLHYDWHEPDNSLSNILHTRSEVLYTLYDARIITVKGKRLVLKAPTFHCWTENDDNLETIQHVASADSQKKYSGPTVIASLKQTIGFFQDGLVSVNNTETRRLCEELLELLQATLAQSQEAIAN